MTKNYKGTIERLIERDGAKCAYCGDDSNQLTIDHILPKSIVGDDNLENLQLLCAKCNSLKSNKIVTESQFLEFLSELIQNNEKFKNTKIQPVINDISTQFDITTEMINEEMWRKKIIEVKALTSYTKNNIERFSKELRSIKDKFKDVDIIFAFPGLLTSESNKVLQDNGIEVWDQNIIKLIFKDTIEKRKISFLNLFNNKLSEKTTIAKSYIIELEKINSGKANNAWVQYQTHIGKILDYLFGDSLSSPITEHSDHWKVNRRDFILRNYAEDGFWAQIRTRYYADFIVLDAKNYTGKIKKQAILQISNYLKLHGTGLFGIIISRNGGDQGSYITARECWAMDNKLVIVLNDDDIKNMLIAKESGNFPEEILRQKIEEFRLSM